MWKAEDKNKQLGPWKAPSSVISGATLHMCWGQGGSQVAGAILRDRAIAAIQVTCKSAVGTSGVRDKGSGSLSPDHPQDGPQGPGLLYDWRQEGPLLKECISILLLKDINVRDVICHWQDS